MALVPQASVLEATRTLGALMSVETCAAFQHLPGTTREQASCKSLMFGIRASAVSASFSGAVSMFTAASCVAVMLRTPADLGGRILREKHTQCNERGLTREGGYRLAAGYVQGWAQSGNIAISVAPESMR
jgi:hypothetical protein